jgi:putative transposase
MSRYRRSLTGGGTFFFTVNLADRKSRLLVDEIECLRQAFDLARQRYPFKMLAYSVLPEHLHAIWRLPDDDARFGLRWSIIKRAFSKQLPAGERSASKHAKREKGIWQRRFWEHQIRDEVDLQRHVDYIHFNAVKHGLVQRAADWPYTSFHWYVESGRLLTDWAGGDAMQDRRSYG